MIAVFAPTYEEFNYWVKEQSSDRKIRRNYKYISRTVDCMGCRFTDVKFTRPELNPYGDPKPQELGKFRERLIHYMPIILDSIKGWQKINL